MDPEASPAITIPVDDDTDSAKKLNSGCNSENNSAVEVHMEDGVKTPYSIDLDGNVDMYGDGDNEQKQDEEEVDE
jgi:hypothetical protein